MSSPRCYLSLLLASFIFHILLQLLLFLFLVLFRFCFYFPLHSDNLTILFFFLDAPFIFFLLLKFLYEFIRSQHVIAFGFVFSFSCPFWRWWCIQEILQWGSGWARIRSISNRLRRFFLGGFELISYSIPIWRSIANISINKITYRIIFGYVILRDFEYIWVVLFQR